MYLFLDGFFFVFCFFFVYEIVFEIFVLRVIVNFFNMFWCFFFNRDFIVFIELFLDCWFNGVGDFDFFFEIGGGDGGVVKRFWYKLGKSLLILRFNNGVIFCWFFSIGLDSVIFV